MLRKLLTTTAVAALVAAGVGNTAQAQTPAPKYDRITSGLICIHGHEGAWNSNTGNGYYGGLQMDYRFMRTYGSEFLMLWGSADKWPIYAQLAAGVRAYSTRGWHPWPNTARYCGLL